MSVTTGVAMDIHFCMGEKAGVDFYSSDNGFCGKCGMKEKKSGCCSDEHQFYKLNTAHKAVSNTSNVSFTIQSICILNIDHLWKPNVRANGCCISQISSFDTGPSRCIKYCIFRL
jgi:hypothetical protein